MNIRIQKRFILSLFAATPLLLAPTVLAQDYEWEQGEDIHEEEWYDPSDWFNDDYDIDYEHDELGTTDSGRDSWLADDDDDWDDVDDTWESGLYDYEYDTAFGTDLYNDSISNQRYGTGSSTYWGAYYDGYYDGYYDDQYGSEEWNASWNANYASAYSDGYYDGFYDSDNEYSYEPYYYVTWYKLDNNQQTAQERSNDRQRERGDRAQNKNQRDRKAMNANNNAKKTGMVRRRGTIESMERMTPPRDLKDHLIMKIRFDDEEQIYANFGPKMDQDRMPFEETDRVTLRGNVVDRDGRKFLMVQRINSGDKEITLRSDSSKRNQMRDNASQNRNSNSNNRNRNRARSNSNNSSDRDDN